MALFLICGVGCHCCKQPSSRGLPARRPCGAHLLGSSLNTSLAYNLVSPFLHTALQAAQVLEVCRSRGVPLLINDRVDVALAVGADGVHIGQVRF